MNYDWTGPERDNIAPCKGEKCTANVLWGRLFGKRHPFDYTTVNNEPVAINSHFDTCPDAGKFRGGEAAQAKRAAGIHEMNINRWNQQNNKHNKPHRAIKWDQVNLTWIVNDKDASKVATMLTKRGGEFDKHDARDVRAHFIGTILDDDYILALISKSAAYNRIHNYFHGFMMSVYSNMEDRKPVCVAGYQLEPYCAIPENML